MILQDCHVYDDYLFDYREIFALLGKVLTLDIIPFTTFCDWLGQPDELWGIFEDLFGGKEGWTHPEVRIIEEDTREVMNYLNEERWIVQLKDFCLREASLPISLWERKRRRPWNPKEEPWE